MTRKTWRRRGLLAVTVALTCIAAACGSDDGGTTTVATTATATSAATAASPSTTATPSTTKAPKKATMAPAITEPVTVRFENYNLFSAGNLRDATLKLLKNFEAANPLIKVETTATRDQEMFQSLQAQLVANKLPDVAQVLLREWDQNIENLPLQVLEDLAGADLDTHLAAVHAYHPKARALTVRDGKTQGLSYVFSTPTLFYNATLMKQAGLDPATTSLKTWDEVAAAAAKVHAATGVDGLYIACIELDWCTQGLLLSNGGRVMSPDRKDITWAGSESLEVYGFWQNLVKTGAHSKLTGTQAQDAFANGKLGFFLQTSAVQGRMVTSSKDKWELRSTGMPSFGTKTPVPVNSGAGLGIFSKDPVKQRAAWELVKYLTSAEAMQVIVTEMGYLPLRVGMMDDPKFLANWDRRDLILPNVKQLDALQPSLSFPGPNALQIRDLFLKSLEKVLFNGADPIATFTESQDRAKKLIR